MFIFNAGRIKSAELESCIEISVLLVQTQRKGLLGVVEEDIAVRFEEGRLCEFTKVPYLSDGLIIGGSFLVELLELFEVPFLQKLDESRIFVGEVLNKLSYKLVVTIDIWGRS